MHTQPCVSIRLDRARLRAASGSSHLLRTSLFVRMHCDAMATRGMEGGVAIIVFMVVVRIAMAIITAARAVLVQLAIIIVVIQIPIGEKARAFRVEFGSQHDRVGIAVSFLN